MGGGYGGLAGKSDILFILQGGVGNTEDADSRAVKGLSYMMGNGDRICRGFIEVGEIFE